MTSVIPRYKMRATYRRNKSAKVGEICYCPSCGQMFKKEHYQQAFCRTKSGTKCKDKYWNTVIPEKRCNTTRISPASAAFMARREARTERDEVYSDFHPFEGLNDDDYKNH